MHFKGDTNILFCLNIIHISVWKGYTLNYSENVMKMKAKHTGKILKVSFLHRLSS